MSLDADSLIRREPALLAHTPWAQAHIETAAPPPSSDDVLINFNESPWGPSQTGRQAMQEGIALSERYPYKILNALFARQQGIPEEFV